MTCLQISGQRKHTMNMQAWIMATFVNNACFCANTILGPLRLDDNVA